MKDGGPSSVPEGVANRGRAGLLFGLIVVAAAILYTHNLGTRSFEANEACSAWAAAMSGPRAILAIPTLVDPGRELVYYIALHYFALMFGYGEASLRALSALLALIAIGLVFLTGREMFGEDVALAAAALWAFNPIAVVLSHTARTYTMFVVIAVAQMLMLWRVRSRPNRLRVATCGALGGLMLYTHLSALVLLATEIGMLARDWICGRRNLYPWIGIAISLALFGPFLPVFLSLSHTLVHGQWLDWNARALLLADQSVHDRRGRRPGDVFPLGARARRRRTRTPSMERGACHIAVRRISGGLDHHSPFVPRALSDAVYRDAGADGRALTRPRWKVDSQSFSRCTRRGYGGRGAT